MNTRNNDPIFAMAQEIGKVSGQNSAILAELARMNEAIVRLETSQEAKHQANISALNGHAVSDEANFKQVSQSIYAVRYFVAGVSFVVVTLWAVIQWATPFITHAIRGS